MCKRDGRWRGFKRTNINIVTPIISLFLVNAPRDGKDSEARERKPSLEPRHPSLTFKTSHMLALNSSFKFFSCLSLCSLCPMGPELFVTHPIPCVFSLRLSLDSQGAPDLDLLLTHLVDPKPTHRSGSGSKIICFSHFYYVYPTWH